MNDTVKAFYEYQKKIFTISSLSSLLSWDQEVNLPVRAADARGEQLGFVSNLYQEYVTRPSYMSMVEKLLDLSDSLSVTDRRCVELAKKDIDLYTRFPTGFVEAYERAKATSQHVRAEARRTNDFALFIPALQETFALTKEYGSYLTKTGDAYDGLLDMFEEGTTRTSYDALFAPLEDALPKIVQRMASTADTSLYYNSSVPSHDLEHFLKECMRQIGFDFERGMVATSIHPFFSGVSIHDNRVNTRYDDLIETIYSTLHETGHALYEMSSAPVFQNSYLRGGASTGVHESQSRLLENIIGRSRAFVSFLLSRLQKALPGALQQRTEEGLYTALTQVRPSSIRVRADEVTYTLHIMVRYVIEKKLFDGSLHIKDIPEAWNSLMQQYVGIVPSTDAEGCLQDIHRSCGYFGYFPTYALGNIASAQLRNTFVQANPTWEDEIVQGDFSGYRARFSTHIRSSGRSMTPNDLLLKTTGESLNSSHYLRYLSEKYT